MLDYQLALHPISFESDQDDNNCADVHGRFNYVHTPTIWVNGIAAVVFFAAFCFAVFILTRYLICKNKCEQKTMIIFYLIVCCDLLARVFYFIMSIYLSQKAHDLLLAAAFSTVFSVAAGVSHSQNLSRLIFDLASVNCETQDQYNHLVKKRYIFHTILVIWIILTGVYITLILIDAYKWASLGEVVLFSCLGI